MEAASPREGTDLPLTTVVLVLEQWREGYNQSR